MKTQNTANIKEVEVISDDLLNLKEFTSTPRLRCGTPTCTAGNLYKIILCLPGVAKFYYFTMILNKRLLDSIPNASVCNFMDVFFCSGNASSG